MDFDKKLDRIQASRVIRSERRPGRIMGSRNPMRPRRSRYIRGLPFESMRGPVVAYQTMDWVETRHLYRGDAVHLVLFPFDPIGPLLVPPRPRGQIPSLSRSPHIVGRPNYISIVLCCLSLPCVKTGLARQPDLQRFEHQQRGRGPAQLQRSPARTPEKDFEFP